MSNGAGGDLLTDVKQTLEWMQATSMVTRNYGDSLQSAIAAVQALVDKPPADWQSCELNHMAYALHALAWQQIRLDAIRSGAPQSAIEELQSCLGGG